MSNLKRRLERLERLAGIQQPLGFPIIFVEAGETPEEKWKKFLADNPQYKESDPKMVIRGLTDEEMILHAKARPSLPPDFKSLARK